MSSFQSVILTIFVFGILTSTLFSCKAIKSTLSSAKQSIANVDTTFQKISVNIDEIQKALVPVDTLVFDAVNGALEGVTSDGSKRNLDTLTATLSRNIVKYVNQALDSLDTGAPAEKLITGLKDSLFAQSTSDEMTSLLNTVFTNAGDDLKSIIEGVIETLSSNKTKNELKGLGNAVVSGITDSLGLKINMALKDVDFNSLRDSLITNLFNREFRDSIAMIANKATEEAGKGTEGTLKFIKDNVMKIIGGIGLLAAGLVWWIYRFRRKDREDISSLLMSEISAAGDHDAIKQLKQNIKSKAEKHKLEDQLNKILKEKNLL